MRRALLAIMTMVLIAAPAQEAFGQCSISTLEINGVVTLCADNGDAWDWTGPGGFTSNAMCVDALVPGTYTLRTFDAVSGTWGQPCSQSVGSAPAGPSCSISGADSVCTGSAAVWCGNNGDFLYSWSGPGGFAASTACVEVTVAGTYTLTLTDRVSGASGEPCSKTLTVSDCAPPPPPPPPGADVMCPAPARWWSRACPGNDQEMFARVAALVDEHSAVWSYGGTVEGMCDLIHTRRLGRAHRAACRQFAVVHANLVARELGMRDAKGQRIGLDPGATLDHVPGVPDGTILRDWVAATESALLSLGDGSRRDRNSRNECRLIRRQARAINDGSEGIACFGTRTVSLDDDEDDDLEAFEPSGEFSASIASSPFNGTNRLRWTLQRAGEVQLDVIDLTGRHVRRLAQGVFSAGTHQLTWDGRDDGGRQLRPGAYFISGRVLDLRVGQRLILLR